jgi:hypothetical protein
MNVTDVEKPARLGGPRPALFADVKRASQSKFECAGPRGAGESGWLRKRDVRSAVQSEADPDRARPGKSSPNCEQGVRFL